MSPINFQSYTFIRVQFLELGGLQVFAQSWQLRTLGIGVHREDASGRSEKPVEVPHCLHALDRAERRGIVNLASRNLRRIREKIDIRREKSIRREIR